MSGKLVFRHASDTAMCEPTSAPKNDAESVEIKFFFVCPPPWVREELMPALIRSEIPCYLIGRHEFVPRICRKFPGSVFFINADRSTGVERLDWQMVLRSWATILIESRSTVVMIDQALLPIRVAEFRKIGIPIAFVELQQSSKEIFRLMFTMALKINQKSQRRAIRINCGTELNAPRYNVQVGVVALRGTIRDISSSGMAAWIPTDCLATLSIGDELKGVQIQLRGSPILVTMKIAAIREIQGRRILIALFQWGIDARSKERIHLYIASCLQDEIAPLLM